MDKIEHGVEASLFPVAGSFLTGGRMIKKDEKQLQQNI
jgi:hypothetical protein